jgi:hypothetical protein
MRYDLLKVSKQIITNRSRPFQRIAKETWKIQKTVCFASLSMHTSTI